MNKDIPLIVKGKGKPLVFLHGFMCSKETFQYQIEYFSNYFKVYAYDLCGFGENKEMPYPYNLNDYVNEFLKICEIAGEKVNVIAHSFGGRIALKAMANHDVIEKAVICGGAGLKSKFSFKKSVKRTIYKGMRPFFKKEKLEKIFFSSDYNQTSGNLKESFKLVTSEHLDNLLFKIDNPILAIYGEKDRETPVYMGKRLEEKVKNCNLIVIKDCGHFCFLDKSAYFNYVVREFLL